MGELVRNIHEPYNWDPVSAVINPLEPAGLGEIMNIFAASMGMLQMLPLILEN